MGRRIRDDRALIVIERGHPSEAILARNRIADPRPREPVVVRSLHVNQGARAAVMVRNVDGRTVRGDPLAVRLRRVEDLRLTVREVVRCVRVSARNGGDSQSGGGERRSYPAEPRRKMGGGPWTAVAIPRLVSPLSRDEPVV